MKSLLSVLALAFGALTFQSCEDYANGVSRGYYHGGYGGDRYGGGYYDGGGYGPTVVVSSGDRERHHGDGYSNDYYDRENDHVNRNVNANRNVQVNRNDQVNRNVHVNRNAHGKPKVHGNPNTDVRKQ
jgi:hypothetical protein